MGHTTRISDYEWDRGDGPKEIPEGYDPSDEVSTTREKPATKSKKVEPKEDKPPVTTTASTKDAKSK